MCIRDSFRFALDAAYGSVDLGTSKLNGKNFDEMCIRDSYTPLTETRAFLWDPHGVAER